MELRCPECESISTASDDILGNTVRCKECHSLFTAREIVRPPLLEDGNDVYDHAHSRRMLAESGLDPRPSRMGVKMVGGCSVLIVVTFLMVFICMMLGKPPEQATEPVLPPIVKGAQKIRLSYSNRAIVPEPNEPFRGVSLAGPVAFDFEFISGDPLVGQYYVRCRSNHGFSNDVHLNTLVKTMSNRGTLTLTLYEDILKSIKHKTRNKTEIWIEENSVDASGESTRTCISNILTQN